MSLVSAIRLTAFERVLLALRARRSHARAPHQETGERGELAAMFHLRQLGFVVVARRWRSAKERGDLDLIAWEGNTLCFLEVKARGSSDIATAESAVDADKRRMMRSLAQAYLKHVEPGPESVRFDIISVYFEQGKKRVVLFRGAYGW